MSATKEGNFPYLPGLCDPYAWSPKPGERLIRLKVWYYGPMSKAQRSQIVDFVKGRAAEPTLA